MAYTSLADIIYTDAYSSYYKRITTEKSALINSGVVTTDQRIQEAADSCPTGSRIINLPYWEDLKGDPQPLVDGTPIQTRKIGLGKDAAIIMRQGNGWSASDLAKARAKSDPIKGVADAINRYWNIETQKDLFALLRGVFAANLASNGGDHILDISGESGNGSLLGKNSILQASQLLGDAKGELVAIAMHSMAESVLSQAENASHFYRPSTTAGELSQYNGRNIIMDDMCGFNPSTGVAEIFLFGAGAIALNKVPMEHETEADRDKASGQDKVYSRRGNILHVRGVKWTDASCEGDSPTRAELATAGNHSRVWEAKDVRVVKLVAKVA